MSIPRILHFKNPNFDSEYLFFARDPFILAEIMIFESDSDASEEMKNTEDPCHLETFDKMSCLIIVRQMFREDPKNKTARILPRLAHWYVHNV